jgi:urease beta subunit
MSAYITWHNGNTDETQTWLMNGDDIQRRVTAQDERGEPIFVGPPWRLVAAHKFEFIWHNQNSNETQIWFMSGNEAVTSPDKIVRRATVRDENNNPIFVGLPWSIVGATRLGEPLGASCIVWHNGVTNETQVWVMNDGDLLDDGERIARRVTVRDENGNPIFVGPPWHVVGVWLNQIAWHNDDTNETQVWEMDANIERIVRRVTIQDENGRPIFVGPPWHTVGATDFNRDPLRHRQNADIVWHNDVSDETQIWIRTDDGQRIARRVTALDEIGRPIFVGLPWRVVATANTDA